MTDTTTTTTAHATRVAPGHVTIVDVPREGGGERAEWAYVLTTLPGRDVLALPLGVYIHTPEPGTVGVYPVTSGDHVTNLGQHPQARDAIVARFQDSPPVVLPDVPTSVEGPGETTAQAYARGVNDGRTAASREFDAWKARATETAHEYADRNELCSEFDRCMEDIGLEPRSGREYLVTYRVTLPRTGTDPWSLDAEDLYSEAEDGAGSPVNVERVH
jgi:hypothetical protein